MRRAWILPALALLIAASAAFAAPVTIRVTRSGQPLEGVVVEVFEGDARVFHGVTDSNGTVVAELQVGRRYTVRVYEWSDKLGGYVQYRFSRECRGAEEWVLELSYRSIDWRPLIIVVGLGVAGLFLLLVMAGAARAVVRR